MWCNVCVFAASGENPPNIMKILLTGAAGNLGSACYSELLKAGHDIVATDISRKPGLPGRVKVGDLLNREFCYEVTEHIACLVHVANLTHAGMGTPQKVFHDNVTMNMNVMQAAVESGCRRIIFASSIQAMSGTHRIGTGSKTSLRSLPISGDSPQNPGNAYALSKCVGEMQLQYYLANGRIDQAAALRFPLLLAPAWIAHQRAEHAHDRLGPNGLADEMCTWLSFEDGARLVSAIIAKPFSGYRCYLPASPQPRFKLSPREIAEKYFPDVPRQGDPDAPLCDIGRITADVGWTPKDTMWD